MLKTIGLFKRRSGLSVEEFRRYYEATHRVIGERYLAGRVERYVRRYLDPPLDRRDGQPIEPEFDVIMEIWYADRAAYDAVRAVLSDPAVAHEIRSDEERLFDRTTMRFYLVDEHDSFPT